MNNHSHPEVSRNALSSVVLAAGVVCFLVFLRALSCDFINWDDGEYIHDNPIIKALDKELLVAAFTSSPLNFWIPLTWISFAVDYHIWGLNPFGYHLTNITLHGINTGMMVLVTDRLWKMWTTVADLPLSSPGRDEAGEGRSRLYYAMLLFAVLLWAIHPARVESVVWVTERKDVLNGLFTLGSIYFYLRYVKKKDAANNEKIVSRDYLVSLLLFLLSLMSKPTSVLLALMLLVIDWYPLGRLQKGRIAAVLIEKVPFLLIGAAVSAVNVYFNEQISAFIPLDFFPISSRVVVIGNSLFEYFRLMLNPLGILPYHHLPMHIPRIFILTTVVSACFIFLCLYFGSKRRWLAAAIISFIIPLLPVLQFFPNGFQPELCLRYTYLPSLFPCIILSARVMVWLNKKNVKSVHLTIAKIALAALIVFYAVITNLHIGDWKNSETFWTKVIAYKAFDRAYYYRALYYVDSVKNYPAAIDDYTKCLQMMIEDKNPEVFNLYASRGEALAKAGSYSEAVDDFDTAISLFPHKQYYYYRGYALMELGRIKEAEDDLRRAGNAKGPLRWIPIGSPLQ